MTTTTQPVAIPSTTPFILYRVHYVVLETGRAASMRIWAIDPDDAADQVIGIQDGTFRLTRVELCYD